MISQDALFSRAYQTIRNANRFLLVSDGRPDGDSVGSTLAMSNWLLREGKNVRTFCKETLPHSLLFLDGAHLFSNDPRLFQETYDVIMTFDASDLRHCGIDDLLSKTPKTYTLVMFDHHATNERFGDQNLLFTDACSTCEIVYRFFETNGISMDARMATSLLAGICTDTSNFSNGGTTAKGIDAAGRLVQCGARQEDVIRHLVKNKSTAGLKLWGLALSRLCTHEKHGLASTYFLREDASLGTDDEAFDGMSNFLNAVCGDTDTILVLRELPNGKIKGSLRSVKRDISGVAQALGGGGHRKAAGFVMEGTVETVRQAVLAKLAELALV